jgi:hypothetical protein
VLRTNAGTENDVPALRHCTGAKPATGRKKAPRPVEGQSIRAGTCHYSQAGFFVAEATLPNAGQVIGLASRHPLPYDPDMLLRQRALSTGPIEPCLPT